MAAEQDWPTYADQAYLAATDTLLARTAGGGGVEVAGLHIVARRSNGLFMAEGANAAVRVSLTGSAEMGGFEIYNGVSHEGSFKSQGSTGETRLSTGRNVGWGGFFSFYTDTTEKMRLNSAGNLGLGVTAPAARLHVKHTNNIAAFESGATADGGSCFISLNAAGGQRMGYWGYGGPDNIMYLLNERNGALYFGAGTSVKWLIQAAGHYIPAADNAYDLGVASQRVRVVFAGTGTINTSDEREKKWRGAATKAELKAATRIFKELGFYQWLDAIDEKNAKTARYHFGVRAQRVWAIMAEEGLVDPIDKDGKPGKTPYAFLCFDEWPEETAPETEGWRPGKILGPDGEPVMVKCRGDEVATEQRPTGNMIVTKEAGNRFGIRPDQLALFLLAAIGDKLDL